MLLNGLRVLDMTQQDGGLCGQILADLGADVVQIEPVAGCPARQLA
ncbi:MAG: CoA transferase, partial [Pseudomonadota bacterium]